MCAGRDGRDAYRVLTGKRERRRPRGRPRLRWENNIKIGLQEMEWGTDWIDVAQYRDSWLSFVIGVINLRVYYEEFLD